MRILIMVFWTNFDKDACFSGSIPLVYDGTGLNATEIEGLRHKDGQHFSDFFNKRGITVEQFLEMFYGVEKEEKEYSWDRPYDLNPRGSWTFPYTEGMEGRSTGLQKLADFLGLPVLVCNAGFKTPTNGEPNPKEGPVRIKFQLEPTVVST